MLPGSVPTPNDGGLLQETRLILGKFSAAPTLARAAAIDALVRALKTNGTWSKRSGLWIYAAHTSQAACVNWIAPGASSASAQGSPTFTANRGFTGNGSDGYLLCGNVSDYPLFTQNDAHTMAWSLTNPAGNDNNYLFGNSAAAGNFHFLPKSTSGNANSRFNSGTSDTFANSDVSGLYTLRRNNSSNYQLFRNASQIRSVSQASAAVTTNAFRVLRHSSSFSALECAMVSIGGTLTDTEIANDHTAFQTYLQAAGAI